MSGGPSHSTEKAQTALSQEQLKIGEQYAGMAEKSLGQMNSLLEPITSYYSGIVDSAKKGNYGAEVAAAGPQIKNVSSQFDAASRTLMDTVPAGPGRDAALAQLPAQQAAATSSTLNDVFEKALAGNTQIGAAYGGVGLSEAGVGTSNLGQSGQTLGQLGSEQAQGKSSTLGFLGSLAGGAGTALAGAKL